MNGQEYGIKKLFSEAWSVYCRQFKKIAQITLVVYVPINILLYLLGSHIEKMTTMLKIIQLSETFIGILATMAVALLVQDCVQQENEARTWKEYLQSSYSHWGNVVRTNLLAALIVGALCLLLLVPGIIWWGYYIFAAQVVALRGKSGKDALSYSKALVKGQWWKTCGSLFLIGLANLIVGVALGYLSAYLPEVMSLLSDTLLDIIGGFFSVAVTLLFLNAESLHKGKGNAEPMENTERRA